MEMKTENFEINVRYLDPACANLSWFIHWRLSTCIDILEKPLCSKKNLVDKNSAREAH